MFAHLHHYLFPTGGGAAPAAAGAPAAAAAPAKAAAPVEEEVDALDGRFYHSYRIRNLLAADCFILKDFYIIC